MTNGGTAMPIFRSERPDTSLTALLPSVRPQTRMAIGFLTHQTLLTGAANFPRTRVMTPPSPKGGSASVVSITVAPQSYLKCQKCQKCQNPIFHVGFRPDTYTDTSDTCGAFLGSWQGAKVACRAWRALPSWVPPTPTPYVRPLKRTAALSDVRARTIAGTTRAECPSSLGFGHVAHQLHQLALAAERVDAPAVADGQAFDNAGGLSTTPRRWLMAGDLRIVTAAPTRLSCIQGKGTRSSGLGLFKSRRAEK